MKQFEELLLTLGLSKPEAEVYIASLGSGNGSASSIAKIAGKQRVTTYEILKRLSKLGFVKVQVKSGAKTTKASSSKAKGMHFTPVNLQEIKNKLSSRKGQLEESLKSIDAHKSIFSSLYRKRDVKPEIFFFEGVEGVVSAMHDTLDQKPKEIISFSSDTWLDSIFNKSFLKEYWDKRVGLKIHTRGIIPKIAKATSYFSKDKNQKELRQVRCIPREQFNFKNEIDIYDNNICIVSLEEGNEHAIVIRSASLAQSMRDVFEVMWLVSERYY
jgi:sugar-specific transcriptional regulator TrmB